jgi:TolA-binding protein
MKRSLLALGICFALVGRAFAADAPSATDLQALDARIRALEVEGQKLREQAAAAMAEATAARTELEKMKVAQQATQESAAAASTAAATAAVTAPPEASAPSAGGANGNAFNPAIAVILNGVYAHHSQDPDRYVRAGFPVVEGLCLIHL